MRLRKKCKFSTENIADLASLHEDMEAILRKSVDDDDPSPEEFVSKLFTYFGDRPNIQNDMQPDANFEKFVLFMAHTHLKATTLHNVLTGKEKRPEIIDSVKDDLEMLRKTKRSIESGLDRDRSIGIACSKTGNRIYNTLEEQITATTKSITNMVDDLVARA